VARVEDVPGLWIGPVVLIVVVGVSSQGGGSGVE
jgi:hypothetical protein